MHRPWLHALVISVVFGARFAHADADVPSTAPTSAMPVTAPAPTATPAIQVPGSVCIVGAHEGVSDVDARTATSLVCSELRELGVRVQGPYQGQVLAQELYRVELHRLGSKLIFVLNREASAGTRRDSRTLQLASLDEVAVAARRVATALVRNTSIAETRQVDNQVIHEVQRHPMVRSEFMWGLGVAGSFTIGAGMDNLYGGELIFQHQAPRYAFGLTAQLLAGEEGAFGAIHVGGKYFLSLDNIAPFVGGGLGVSGLGVESANRYYSRGGIGAQVEVGVEFLRFHNSRVGAALRAEIPFFAVGRDDYYDEEDERDERYVLPVGLHAYYLF